LQLAPDEVEQHGVSGQQPLASGHSMTAVRIMWDSWRVSALEAFSVHAPASGPAVDAGMLNRLDADLLDVFVSKRVYELAASYRPDEGLFLGGPSR